MKAAQYNKYGGVEVIEINNNATVPSLSKGQILVEVYAGSLNRVEKAIRDGYMEQMLPLTFPVNLGGDFSGIVSEVADGITGFGKGDRVYGVANQFKGGSGALGEYVAVNADNTALSPETLDFKNASAMPLIGTTAIQALTEHIQLKKGQKILIQGGAGGVGMVAIQLAKHLGAYVATTAATADLDRVKSYGADEVIDYKKQDFTGILKDYDAVLDTVGSETATGSLKILKKDGIIVSLSGGPDVDSAKQKGVRTVDQFTTASTEQLNYLADLIDQGVIIPLIDRVFTLDETKDAYSFLETGHLIGKIVVEIKKT